MTSSRESLTIPGMDFQGTSEPEKEGWLDWTYKGVDHSFPGNGGLECRDFLSLPQRYWESGAASIVAILALMLSYPRLRLPPKCKPCGPCPDSKGGNSSVAQAATVYEPVGKRILLLLMCLTFGIELGFKFATRQMIWIGNPCHLATMMQIFILSAPPSRIVTSAFRLHMHMLTGAPIAILFPVINTRLLPFETGVYFLQHVLMLVIPFYCLWLGDPFIPEKLGDFSWAMTSFGLLFLYHFLPLQFLAYISQVNLNNMLCPAVSDPFRGKFYRLFAIGHQFVLIPTLGKVFVIMARAFGILARDSPQDCEHAVAVITKEDGPLDSSQSCCPANTSRRSRFCQVSTRPRSPRVCSRSRYSCSSISCLDFYRRRRLSCLDDDCCRRVYCSYRPTYRTRGFYTALANRCWSNTSGLTVVKDTDLQKVDPIKKAEKEEEEDSGFLGAATSGETITTASNFTTAATSARGQAGEQGDSSSSTRGSSDKDGVGTDRWDYCYSSEKSDDDGRYSDSGSSTESQRQQENQVDQELHCLKQQKPVDGGWGDGSQAGLEDASIQHIINGQMVERRSSSGHGQQDPNQPAPIREGRSGVGQTLRHRNSGQDHVLGRSSSSSSGTSHQQRKSREIVVEGGPPLRVFELKSCGNSSKVTSSVERALASGNSSAVADEDTDFRKIRSKVH